MTLPRINSVPLPTYAEKFFVQRALELLNADSIDSYRLPLHNPKTLLQEITQVIKGINSDEISRDEYAWMLVEEVALMFERPTYIRFTSINEKYFKMVLRKKQDGLNPIFYACTILLNDNKKYEFELIKRIRESILEINALANPTPQNLDALNDLISFFLIELRGAGYSKQYLYKFIKSVFCFVTSARTFNQKFQIIVNLNSRPKEKYEVIVGLHLSLNVAGQLQILDPEIQKIDSKEILSIIARTNEKVRAYFSANPSTTFFRTEVEGNDYYSASILVRKSIKIILDILFMGYSGDEFTVNPRCIVIGANNEKMAGVQFLNYQLDGYYTSSQRMYRVFSERIKSIRGKGISPDAINRIEAALRYLRLGSGVEEIENKLLNYWIGMEYFFSSNDSKNSKTFRMREYFKILHGKAYYKRLLMDFHQKLRSNQLNALIPTYEENLKYLEDPDNFNFIMSDTTIPLLAYRAYRLKQRVFSQKELIADIQRHTRRVEWNLVRIYRQRNSIVHSASSDSNILEITSHLKYYLLFVINSAVDYLNISKLDINMDGRLTLDDYFLASKAEFENLVYDDKFDIEKIIKLRNPVEFLS